MQFRKLLGYYCLGLVLIYLCLIFSYIVVDACEGDSVNEIQTDEQPQNELFARTHEVDCIELTYEDAQLLMQIAQAEAGNQGTDGMWLVMCSVWNRANDTSGIWPDSIKGVIYQPFQYYTKGMKAEISPECHEALARIEKGDIAPNIVAFEKTTNKSLEKYFSSAFDYRDHRFYTLKK